MVGRCEKVAGTCDKLMKKLAKIGGKHIWHQDYGYWYNYGKENSCLQVLPGSHKSGRIENLKIAAQLGADINRVEEKRKHFPLKYIEMKPGDALFFHCNLLHCSSANTSGKRRWALLCAYNRAVNDPIWDHDNPHYTKLEKVPNSAVLDCTNFTDMTGNTIYGENLENIPGRRKISRDEQ